MKVSHLNEFTMLDLGKDNQMYMRTYMNVMGSKGIIDKRRYVIDCEEVSIDQK